LIHFYKRIIFGGDKRLKGFNFRKFHTVTKE